MIFIESEFFVRRLSDLASGREMEVLAAIQNDLLKNPERGNVVRGLGGIRKARVGDPAHARGKRGGYRYFYLYLAIRGHIHLLHFLDKTEVEDLSNTERIALNAAAAAIKSAR